jgi:hypothetical protein
MSDETCTGWDWTPQQGEKGECYRAQVWGPDGDSIATIESYPDPQTANDRARLIAAAGTAAQEVKEMGYDPQKAVEVLPELLEALEFARGGASRSGYNLPEHTKEKLRSVLASASYGETVDFTP